MVTRGERAPDFVARSGDGRPTRFYGYAGVSPTVLVFSGAGGEPTACAVRDDLAGALDRDVRVHVIAADPYRRRATSSGSPPRLSPQPRLA
jgi:peroxiredoxin